MMNVFRTCLFALLVSGLSIVGCGGDDTSGGTGGGSAGGPQGGGGGLSVGGNGSGGSSFGGGAGASNGGVGGLPTTCELPLSVELGEFAPQVEAASFQYFSPASCRVIEGNPRDVLISILRATSNNGALHIYSALTFTWEWVSYSAGELSSEAEIRLLPEDTDISVTLRDRADQQHEVDVVFRLSGTQFTVLSASERN
ncbi:MAG: hypothetical protein R3B07_15305 [Polyangiaceae bacterium]